MMLAELHPESLRGKETKFVGRRLFTGKRLALIIESLAERPCSAAVGSTCCSVLLFLAYLW